MSAHGYGSDSAAAVGVNQNLASLLQAIQENNKEDCVYLPASAPLVLVQGIESTSSARTRRYVAGTGSDASYV